MERTEPSAAVANAIGFIWEHYSEPVSLAQLAESAGLSRFYFTRLFRQATGITPGRFVASVRLCQARRLLEGSTMPVNRIARAVGYGSLGSFTSSFTDSVGLSPSRFRRAARSGDLELPCPPPGQRAARGAVAGTISLPEGSGSVRVYVGAFATPLLRHPVAAAVLIDVPGGRPCCYQLPDVPAGTWWLQATGSGLAGGHGEVTVTAGVVVSAAVRLRPVRPTDPPVLLALPDLEPPPADPAAMTPCAAVSSLPPAGS